MSKNNGVIGPRSREKTREIFGDNAIIVSGRGANYDNATNPVQTTSPNHAEARGIQALLSRDIEVEGARQATTLPSCEQCERLQRTLDIINLTGNVGGSR